jgi:hypothetical protein
VEAEADNTHDDGQTSPVFVLCAGRSGSTLLRFLLDAHPELACPPETELPAMCGQVATVWSIFERPTDDQPAGAGGTPEPVIAGLRQQVDLMVGPYLARRGKRRFCDKSLGSARHADLLARMYPDARFICLYRHPMDLIASGLEACPWGLNSYGFEHYAGGSPQNMVAALARYWVDHTTSILAAQDNHLEQSLQVRYEDLVADPAAVAERIFAFIGAVPAPGITGQAFSHDRERFGRSDFKIWNTSRITPDSVGRGWKVPASLMSASLLETVNGLAGRLGYRPVDRAWGSGSRPADMLAPADGGQPTSKIEPATHTGPATRTEQAGQETDTEPGPGSRLLGERVAVGVSRIDDSFGRRWKPYSADRFVLAAVTPQGAGSDHSWTVDLSARTVIPGNGQPDATAQWRASGTDEAWHQVIADEGNLGVAFRSGRMRYSDNGDAGPGSLAADTRLAMMADLLGITRWPASLPASESAQGSSTQGSSTQGSFT